MSYRYRLLKHDFIEFRGTMDKYPLFRPLFKYSDSLTKD